MTRRQWVADALAGRGDGAIGAVICYEGIFVRDHWDELTQLPWWYRVSFDLDQQLEWHRRALARTDLDWFYLPTGAARSTRARYTLELRGDQVWQIDTETAAAVELQRPQVSGWNDSGLHSVHPTEWVTNAAQIEARVPAPPAAAPDSVVHDGRGDLATRLLAEFGHERYPLVHVASPLWRCYALWGFEGMMTLIATRPDLVQAVCARGLALERHAIRQAAALGAAGIWIEECLTDMISPQAFARLNLPVIQALVEEIRAAGMQSIYYYCGDPAGKWDLLRAAGADALALEESKKGFVIDIDTVARQWTGPGALLGNLDAIGVLQDGSDSDLRREVERQLAVGRRHGRGFVMSLGSPVTPSTPVTRVRQYVDLVHELGS